MIKEMSLLIRELSSLTREMSPFTRELSSDTKELSSFTKDEDDFLFYLCFIEMEIIFKYNSGVECARFRNINFQFDKDVDIVNFEIDVSLEFFVAKRYIDAYSFDFINWFEGLKALNNGKIESFTFAPIEEYLSLVMSVRTHLNKKFFEMDFIIYDDNLDDCLKFSYEVNEPIFIELINNVEYVVREILNIRPNY